MGTVDSRRSLALLLWALLLGLSLAARCAVAGSRGPGEEPGVGGADRDGSFADEWRGRVSIAQDRSTLEQPSSSVTPTGGWSGFGPSSAVLDSGPMPVDGARRPSARADPEGTAAERSRNGMRNLALILLLGAMAVSAGGLVLFWVLRPLKTLEEGLERLARGASCPVLPEFSLGQHRRMAVAIVSLAQALEDARAKERGLSRCLIELQESERFSLARELHDELGQSIAAIGVAAAYVERHAASAPPETLIECAAEIRRESGRLAVQMRERLNQLRPQGLEGAGLRDALGRLIEGWGPRAPGLVVEAEIPDALPELTDKAGLALYRTVQEALTNAVKHSGASRVRIGLTRAPGWLVLTVADDGCGRSEEALRDARGGLLGMRERAEEADGMWRLGASPLGGLGIELRLPIDDRQGRNHDPNSAARRSRGGT